MDTAALHDIAAPPALDFKTLKNEAGSSTGEANMESLRPCQPLCFELPARDIGENGRQPSAITSVHLVGSFGDWAHKVSCPWSAIRGSFCCVIQLPVGLHVYKFIVEFNGDTEWVCGPGLRVRDEGGNLNNFIKVEDPAWSSPNAGGPKRSRSSDSLSLATTPRNDQPDSSTPTKCRYFPNTTWNTKLETVRIEDECDLRETPPSTFYVCKHDAARRKCWDLSKLASLVEG
eukprot:CAMPEP_0114556900 /NCGR_PEP_ID=MMETSP0114-20121206/9534_1 /TAXON_ID=31324 /ORGANISM="Goniomonas sp, Strain m" /LENGTH=230 /DNA_ID=CAMNT_0001742133 /DNA_START=37 /DNA_END=729 /DNA_ORIENTATION=+